MPVSRAAARLAALVSAIGLAAPVVGIPVAPATAASCTTDHGVSVVVDFHQLGGGLHEVCDADGGGRLASRLFSDNGFALTYIQRQPGFVCQVSGEPAATPCLNTPPADAYWSFWSAEDSSEDWTYASRSVDSLRVPDGGRVALSWSQGAGSRPPGTTAGSTAPETERAATEQSDEADHADEGLPVWVAPVVLAVLAVVAATLLVVRRRSGDRLP